MERHRLTRTQQIPFLTRSSHLSTFLFAAQTTVGITSPDGKKGFTYAHNGGGSLTLTNDSVRFYPVNPNGLACPFSMDPASGYNCTGARRGNFSESYLAFIHSLYN